MYVTLMSDSYFSPSFLFYLKKWVTFYLFFRIFFLDFLRKKTRTCITNLRHSSLDSNVFDMYVRFQLSNLHIERAIHVQKIKVQTIIFEYIPLRFTDSIVHFYQIHIIRKVLYAFLYALKCIYVSLVFIL